MIANVLAALDRYVEEHFRLEEQMMRTYGFFASTAAFSFTVNPFLRNRLINTIQKPDMADTPLRPGRRQRGVANNGA